MTQLNDLTRTRALALLSAGVSETQTADAIGVSVSRITQLISEEQFRSELGEAKFAKTVKHIESDSLLDSTENRTLVKLNEVLEYEMRPLVLLRAFQVLNSAKRRAVQDAHVGVTSNAPIVQVSMPVKVINKFTTNVYNQVIQAGSQELITMQSGNMAKFTAAQPETLEHSKLDSDFNLADSSALM